MVSIRSDEMSKKIFTFWLVVSGVILMCLIAIYGLGDQIKGAGKMRFGIDIRGGIEAVFEPVGLDRVPTSDELDAARNVIETRLDDKNILEREVTIDKKKGYIIVRFPWKSDEANFDPQAAIEELGETAQLTFRDPEGNIILDGSHVASSSPGFDQQLNEYVVQLAFDEEGGKLFEEATGRLIGQAICIFMDETLISYPTVNQQISGGKCVIEGMAGIEEAKALSEKINAGALPFSMNTTNYSTISPSLGNGALHIMVVAGLVAFGLVCIFMIGYYRLPGFISCIALCLQMALQLLVISVPQVTLTLPGIAGIILSLGMAVDANVIISERISEEIAKGMTIRLAVKKGYEKAFASVFDGNLTSAIVAIFLMVFGSGSMLSFGYTLLTGLVINFGAGIFVSKYLLMAGMSFKTFNKKGLYIKKKPHKTIPFYQKKKIAFCFSIILIITGMITCIIGGVKLDTQFAGGTVLKYTYEGNPNTDHLGKEIENIIKRNVNIQVTVDPATQKQKMMITLAGESGISLEDQQNVLKKLNELEPDMHFDLAESYSVEPYIGAAALKKAILAISLSFIFIIFYVWFRFKSLSFSAGVMAVVALVHDIILVFFVFSWFGIPLNDAYVAVTLTIIGYSINDTIVLYDRLRENKSIYGKHGLGELLSISITQTLSRSVNTSLTTIVCVLSLLIFSLLYGIESIRVFSLPMLFGLISGCYSSICIAGPLWGLWQERSKKKQIKHKVA